MSLLFKNPLKLPTFLFSLGYSLLSHLPPLKPVSFSTNTFIIRLFNAPDGLLLFELLVLNKIISYIEMYSAFSYTLYNMLLKTRTGPYIILG